MQCICTAVQCVHKVKKKQFKEQRFLGFMLCTICIYSEERGKTHEAPLYLCQHHHISMGIAGKHKYTSGERDWKKILYDVV